MANEQNLLKGNEKHTFTPEELSKGGKASAEARRKKRDLRQAIEILLDTDIKGKNGEVKSGAEAIAIAQFQKALKGDTRAFEVIRDTSGQGVVQKVAVAEVDMDVINEIENMVLNDD
jgi:hypothetical protein